MPGPYNLSRSATIVMMYTILDRCGNRPRLFNNDFFVK